MPVLISMLRAVNVGGHCQIKMEALRTLYSSLKFENPQTYVQSGNVIFKTNERDLALIAKNPFAERANIEPNKLLVTFLASDPSTEARENLRKQKFAPEELHVADRELYIYFPNGIGKSKLPWSRLDKILQTPGTGRNWNSVTKMLEIAEKLET